MAKKTKVLHIIDSDFSGRFFEVLIPDQSIRYRSVGLLSLVGERGFPIPSAMKNVKYLETKNRQLNRLLRLLFVIFEVLKFMPNVIITHLPKAGLLGNLLALVSGRNNIYFRHYLDEHHKQNKRSLRILDKIVNNTAKSIVTMSNQTKQWLINEEGVNPKKITVIHQALDYEGIKVNVVNVEQIRLKYVGTNGTKILILCVSRFIEAKGQKTLVDALIKMRLSGLDPVGLFIGAGESIWLQRYIIEKNCQEFCFIEGFKANSLDYIAATDIVAHPSEVDSFSQLVMESKALGRAIVASDSGSVRDQIQDEIDGYIVKKRNSEELADRLCVLANDKSLRDKMGKAAMSNVRRKFPLVRMLNEINEVVLKG